MRRIALSSPVCLVGIPLLVCLFIKAAPPEEGAAELVALPAPLTEPVADDADQGALPTAAAMAKLAREDPVAFLENCLRRYDREVKGYQAIFQKQERLQGKLHGKEIMELYVREQPQPWAVFMRWLEGAGKAERVLYVKGENNDKMLVHPAGFAGKFVSVVERDVDGAEAQASGRYALNQSGIKNGSLRTLASMKAARAKGTLHVEYLGEQQMREAGDRMCFKFHRAYEQPEHDGVMELTYYVDKENWLQVGSIVKAKGNKLLGEYFFHTIKLNPDFAPDQFTREAVAK
jgi:hypothetical protein